MRLRRLDLIRFGHFTDAAFDLPASAKDVHIVFGPNEAGKSTALAAIEDLLFGIPLRSPYNFLHDYKDMRIGATLERDGSVLDVRRRKGTKGTLLDTNDLPVPGGDATLRPFLENADRAFFERMFSLDHTRLEQGGQEILSASDEVGQMLFSAGAGIGGLRNRLAKLDEEADSLWGPRKSAKRRYTQADDRLNEAQRALREQTLTAKNWKLLRRTFEDAAGHYNEIQEEIQNRSADAKRLSRIRRVYRYVRQKGELEGQIEALGSVLALPENAQKVLETAERDESIASASIRTLSAQLAATRKELDGLNYDEAIVARAADVRALNERRIEIRREKADLPKRRAELEAAETALRTAARELDWHGTTVDELFERIPTRSVVKVVSTLLGTRGGLAEAVTSANKELEEADSEVGRLRVQTDAFGEPPDVSNLSAAIKAVREMGDVGEHVLSAKQRVLDATDRVDRIRDSLNPQVESADTIATIKVPSMAEVQEFRDDLREYAQRQREVGGQIQAKEDDLAIARTECEQTVRDERAITRGELEESRTQRNALWDLVKRTHIEGATIGEDERFKYAEELRDLAGGFEAKMQAADQIADDRFESAEASGRLAEMSRSIELKEEQIAQLRTRVQEHAKEGAKLDVCWDALWVDAPLPPVSPDSMLEWLKNREELLKAIENLKKEESAFETSRAQEQEAKECLLKEMVPLDVERSKVEDTRLRVMLERASDLLQHHTSEMGKLDQLRSGLADAERELERRGRDSHRADDAWATWQSDWGSALEKLGLAATLAPAEVEAQIGVIDDMRDKVTQIDNLRNERIAKIERDIDDFAEVTAALAQTVAEDLGGLPSDEAVLELVKRADEAERFRGLRESKEGDVEEREKQIEEFEESRDAARRLLRDLHDAAGTDSVDALRQAIEKSDQRRQYRAMLTETGETLRNEGDGLAVAELELECSAVDVDKIAAIEETNASELKGLEERRAEATDARSEAKRAFEAVGGDDAAASAEAARQGALTEIGEVAERYARVRTSAVLLRWAIDRFRREKQAPLLKRAGVLFATLTGGSFSGLRVDFDEDDTPQLIGYRPSGENVEVRGMSSGTADQLYLALRVASVEDYLGRAGRLPFVADDLFNNFDDERAAAGFQVLGELASKTQVLFFTHHQHLVQVAREALGGSVSVVSLDGSTGSSPLSLASSLL